MPKKKTPKKKRKYISKRPRQGIDLTGLSYDDIVKLVKDYGNKLTQADLQKINSKLRSMANKRLKRLEKSGKANRSVAYQERQKQRRKRTSLKGKKGETWRKLKRAKRFKKPKLGKNAINQLRKELSSLLNFLEKKSSTLKGVNEILKKIENDIGHFDNEEQISDFFDTYHRLLEEMNISRERRDNMYLALRGILYDLMNGDEPLSEEEIRDRMNQIVDELENKRDEDIADMGIDDFRELAHDINKEIDESEKDENFTIQTQDTFVDIYDPRTWRGVPKDKLK